MKNEDKISFVDKSKSIYIVKNKDELKGIIERCRKENIPFSDLDLSMVELRNIDMSCLTIENVIFNRFDVSSLDHKLIFNVCFKGSRLRKVSFAQCKLERCNFDKWEPTIRELEKLNENNLKVHETYIEEADFFFCKFKTSRFRRTKVRLADFRYSSFSDCSLGGSRIELGDFYMAAFKGTTNFTDCLWSNCSITNATFENFCLRFNSINKLVQEDYESYSKIIIGYETWHKQNPCADFSFLNEGEDKGLKTRSLSFVYKEASEVYAMLSGNYAEKGLFRDSNMAYEKAKRNEALSKCHDLRDNIELLKRKFLNKGSDKADEIGSNYVRSIFNDLTSMIAYLVCWLFGFGYKLSVVVGWFVALVIGYFILIHVNNNDIIKGWSNQLGYSLNNSMGPIQPVIDTIGCGWSSIQTTVGLLLVSIVGFILANRIRNNY